ncbi:hypothetical protein ACH4PU_30430 [Streptomyces sp. NPDC021100]|uniref:hypothetical protein n=1 Tax=Streptomyces sp. NPDC021100 TaxID=3365114 RepID=UPI0037A737B2
MFLRRFTQRTRPAPAAREAPHACAALDDIPLHRMFSPLITELLATRVHTGRLDRLASRESCPEEFRLVARPIITELLRAWAHQTGGRGSIEELLESPSTSQSTRTFLNHAAGNESQQEHGYAT